MIVKIREIIRDCITFGMHFIYTRIYQMNIDKSAKLSFGAILDKSNPKGVHIGEESFIASGAVILAHDFSKPAKADTYIGKRCFIGVNAIIMCGVKVNDNVIVGSGSVVTKDMNDNRIQLNGIKVHPFPSDSSLLEYVEEHKGILVAINAEKILHANEQIQDIVNRNIGYCDGIGAVMAVRQHGAVDAVKIAGCELWLKIITTLYQKEKTFYLVGSKQPVIEKTISRLKEDFPGIQITGYRNGYIQTETEQEELIEDIKTKQPDVIFVAMGSPKQELLMEKMYQAHPAIYQGLGGSFDVYTGNVKRAPEWWIKHNLEFAYRLLKQPSRIKRQIHLIKFLILVKTGKI